MELNETFTVDTLRPVVYDFKPLGKKHIGFIAHEVQEFYPFLVSGVKDGPHSQSMNYNGFIGILTKEIQVLKKKVAEQDTRIQTLEKFMINK
jgi:flagellar biosynthesis chaperone FliJ